MDFSNVYKQTNQLVYFSPDQMYLATVVGHKLILRDADTLQMAHVIAAMDSISYIQFSPDTKYILCASYELGMIQVWTLDGHEPVAQIEEGLAGCIKVMWHPLSRTILSWSQLGLRLSIWNLIDAHLMYIPQPKHLGSGFSFRSDARYFAILERVQCKDTLSIYDGVDWELVKKFPIDTIDAKDLAWSPDGRYIAIWDTILEYKIVIYTPEGQFVQTYSAYDHGLGIKQVQWSPSGQFLAVGSFDQKVRILNHYTFQPLIEWFHGATCPTRPKSSVTVFRQTVLPAIKTHHGWPASVMATRPKLQYERIQNPTNLTFPSIKMDPDKPSAKMGIANLLWSPDGKYLAVKNENMPTLISIYSIVHLSLKVILQPTDTIKCMAWHPTQPHVLVYCTGTETLHFWDGQKQVPSHTRTNPSSFQFTTATPSFPHSKNISNTNNHTTETTTTTYNTHTENRTTQVQDPTAMNIDSHEGVNPSPSTNHHTLHQEKGHGMVPTSPMHYPENDEEEKGEEEEDDCGLAECIDVPATEFRIMSFRWSEDGKKVILLDKQRFCIAFEVEVPSF